MITQAVIVEIYTNDNGDTGEYTVHVPLFDTVLNRNVRIKAHSVVNPGEFGGYALGDYVWIAFDNNEAGKPVILGLINQGTFKQQTQNKKRSTLIGKTLIVDSKAELPSDTSFGITTVTNINQDINKLKADLELLKPLSTVSETKTITNDNQIIKVKTEQLNLPTTFKLGSRDSIPYSQRDIYRFKLILTGSDLRFDDTYTKLSTLDPNYKLPSLNISTSTSTSTSIPVVSKISCVYGFKPNSSTDMRYRNLKDIYVEGRDIYINGKTIIEENSLITNYVTLNYLDIEIEYALATIQN